MLVYCGQTVRWIKIGLILGHIVLDGDPAPKGAQHLVPFLTHVSCGQSAGWIKMPLGRYRPQHRRHCVRWEPSSPQRGTAAPSFRPMSIVDKRMDGSRYAAWYEGRPQPRSHCVRWGVWNPPPHSERGTGAPLLSPCLLWPNGWMDQDATSFRGRPRPRRHCDCVARGWTNPLEKKGTAAPPPLCKPMSIVAKRLDATGFGGGLGQASHIVFIVLDGDPAPRRKGQSSPLHFLAMSIVAHSWCKCKRNTPRPISATAEIVFICTVSLPPKY